jgi:type II secretory pathway pseudopilin PulG
VEILLPVVIAVIVSLMAPAMSDWLKGRRDHDQREQEAAIRAKEKAQDWARQDALTNALKANTEQAATTVAKLDDIATGVAEVHTLTNSAATAGLKRELAGLERELVAAEKEHAGEGTAASAAAVEAIKVRIADLKADIVSSEAAAAEALAARKAAGQ